MSLRLLAIALLVLFNAFFVCAEFALVRARRARLEALARNGDRLAARALKAINSLPRLLSASQVGITLSSLGLGWLLSTWFFATDSLVVNSVGQLVGAILALVVVAYLHILFGELVPKVVALGQPERVARILGPPLSAFAWITLPFTWLLGKSVGLVTRRVRDNAPSQQESVHSSHELRLLVERSQEGGTLGRKDADLLEGVFEFSEKNARGVMTPRTEIVALPHEATLDEALAEIEESAMSRYPIYEGSIDNIVGVVLAKDLLPHVRRGPDGFSLKTVMRDVHFIPGTREVEDVLADFKRLKEHLAIVLDEYGGTAGLVTMEDLLEEIVGEILDEYDDPLEPLGAPRAGEFLAPGDTNIAELNERYGLAVSDTDCTTIGGYVFGSLGRAPKIGDRVTAGGAVFTVRAVDGHRASTLAVKLMSTGESGEKPGEWKPAREEGLGGSGIGNRESKGGTG